MNGRTKEKGEKKEEKKKEEKAGERNKYLKAGGLLGFL